MNKSQVSLEYVVIVAFGILVAGMLWIYASSNIDSSRWEIQLSYAKNTVNQIASAADMVYLQGPPAKIYIYPNFPDNTAKTDISGNKITIQLSWVDGSLRNVSASSISNLNGSLSPAYGTHKILVQAVGNFINIREA
jgi:uncharacterized protein (UPF0333 family)